MPDMHRHHVPTIVWNAVRIAATIMDVDPEEIFDKNRTRRVLRARQGAVWGVRTVGSLSYHEIGQALAKDHSTIVNAYNRFCSALKRGDPWADGMSTIMHEQLVWGTPKKLVSHRSELLAYEAEVRLLQAVAAGCHNLTNLAKIVGTYRMQTAKDVSHLVTKGLLKSSHDPLESGHRFGPTITLSPTGATFLAQITPPKSCEEP